MTKKGAIQLLLGLILILGSIYLTSTVESTNTGINIGLGLLLGSLVDFLVYLWEEKNRIKIILQTQFLKRNQPIRISLAYLFRIQVDGKFLLVKNHRGQPGYQPVGGVYRYLPVENADIFDELGVIPCSYMPIDKQSRNDLRKHLKHRHHLNKFLKWFESKKNREIDPWREFYEELIADEIVDGKIFPYIQFNLIRSDYGRVQRSEAFPIDEFLYADIFELKWENEQQKAEITRLLEVKNEKFLFATAQEIQQGYTKEGKVILQHSKKIL